MDLQITTEPLGLFGMLSSYQLLGLPYLVDQTSVITLPMDYSLQLQHFLVNRPEYMVCKYNFSANN